MRGRLLIAVLAVATSWFPVPSQGAQAVPVEFLSEGSFVRGRFFPSVEENAIGTLLLVPGWPGNPQDVLGLGGLLAELDMNVLMFNPRGMHLSEGTFSFANALEDIGAALEWLRQSDTQERFSVDTTKIVLGGYSFGGGMAMACAATEPGVRRVISIAGNDHGVFVRKVQGDPQYDEAIRQMLTGARAPDGPARFDDVDLVLQELAEHQDVYGLQENASRLADRSILLMGGWDDLQVSMEDVLLPFYRALKEAGASDVTFLAYHDDHGFGSAREELATDIQRWLSRHLSR
ncbi:MAG: alpha/beta fold hydrolase [Candidatus Eisenbacteria bacterium]